MKNLVKIMSPQHRIFLVDTPLGCFGLGSLLTSKLKQIEICGSENEFPQASDHIGKMDVKPDLILTDLSVGGKSAMSWIGNMLSLYPDLRILVLSSAQEDYYALRIINIGGAGYISKLSSCEYIVSSVEEALQKGMPVLSEKMNLNFLHSTTGRANRNVLNPINNLTNRQMEVLLMIGQGQTTSTIAETLTLSVKTIETHRSHIIKKLYLKNDFELIRYAILSLNEKI